MQMGKCLTWQFHVVLLHAVHEDPQYVLQILGGPADWAADALQALTLVLHGKTHHLVVVLLGDHCNGHGGRSCSLTPAWQPADPEAGICT